MGYFRTVFYASLLALIIAASPLRAAPQRAPDPGAGGKDAFAGMDANKDGAVSRDEWKGSDDDFKRRDSDNSGSLSRYEFYQELVPGDLQ